ncbi:hypothetical protein DL93DRAFT_2164114 [Clavulina sp. PMI_390]|nr:hypothetical protein DL93DRAFT_2164114 [Clavulina sp. PMI_390]
MPGKAPVGNDDVIALKAQGDAAYRARKLAEARQLYTQALELQEIPTIRSNLAATQFEIGDYESSIKNSEKVVNDLGGNDHDTNLPLQLKNDLRRCRALILLKRWDTAVKILQPLSKLVSTTHELNASTSQGTVQDLLHQATLSIQADSFSTSEAQEHVHKLPRYRPPKRPELEYYTIGHDSPTSLLGSPRAYLKDTSDNERLRMKIPRSSIIGTEQWSFDALLIGSGDARHLYSSLFDIADQLRAGLGPDTGTKTSVNKKGNISIHFTLAEIHPATICRNLIMLLALDEAASTSSSNTTRQVRAKKVEDMCTLMHFCFWGVAMPRYTHSLLMDLIRRVRHDDLPSWIRCTAETRAKLNPYLDYWLNDCLKQHTVRDMVSKSLNPTSGFLAHARDMVNSSTASSYEDAMAANDRAYYKAYPGTLREREAFSNLKATWLPNVTFLTQGWPHGTFGTDVFKALTDFFDPPYMQRYGATALSSFHDHSTSLWLGLLESLDTIRRAKCKLTIELFADDGFKVSDDIRTAAAANSRDGPALFDRIHLSNVPDYTGGPLTAFMDLSGILKSHRTAFITFCCLLNPTSFSQRGDGSNASKLEHDRYIHSGILLDEIGSVYGFKRELPLDYMGHYMVFSRDLSISNKPQVTRDRLARIIYDVFFKTVAPIEWTTMSPLTIRQSLNLQNWFRFIIFLAEQNYPWHWLSEIIDGMLDGKISTVARPPTSLPHPIPSNLGSAAPQRVETISLAPFVHELRTFSALWAPTFPFSLASPHVPPTSELRTCQLKTKAIQETYFIPTVPTYCLKFYRDQATAFRKGQINLLNTTETSNLVFISTIDFHYASRTVTFLVTRAALTQLQQEGWYVGLWSFIEGQFVAAPKSCTTVKEVGGVEQWAVATNK